MSNIPFDTADKISPDKYLELKRQAFAKARANMTKTGGPHKEPPHVPPLNPNPIKHDIVAWRHDGRLDHWKFETKESALDHVRFLGWAVYWQWALMCGRDMVEKHAITIPDGMALSDDGLPYKIAI